MQRVETTSAWGRIPGDRVELTAAGPEVSGTDVPDSSYASTLTKLAELRPRVSGRLVEAEQVRAKRLDTYLSGARLHGLEQLLTYLDTLRGAYAGNDALRSLVFLLDRATADVETALEATLSGYQGVAADAMRDVMEIEYLLLDFATTPGHADRWRAADRKARLREFAPSKVRDRLVASGLPPFGDEGWEAVDYRAHSEALHVTPSQPPIGSRGMEPSASDSMWADAGFIEMFEHGWRFIRAAELLRMSHIGADSMEPLAPLDAFFDARDRTREMLKMLMALYEAPAVLHTKLGREPSPVEVLKHVRTALITKSPRRPSTSES